MSATLQVSVSVPGKVMLAGEYSALTGAPAMAASLSLTLNVQATALPANTLGGCRVSSNLWSEAHLVTKDRSPIDFPTEPLLAAVASAMTQFDLSDVEVTLSSDLAVQYGIGSSSALRLAVIGAFNDLAQQKANKPLQTGDELAQVARSALALQRTAQKEASGYDIATQWLGGIVISQTSSDLNQWPQALLRFSGAQLNRLNTFVHVLVGGKGAPTSAAIGKTSTWLNQDDRRPRLDAVNAKIIAAIRDVLEADADLTISQLTSFRDLLKATESHCLLFQDSPGFPADLFAKAAALPGWKDRWVMKTTGAGGEDAVIIFGSVDDAHQIAAALAPLGWHLLPASFGEGGLSISRSTPVEEA